MAPGPDRPRPAEPGPVETSRHRQQLLGRAPGDPFFLDFVRAWRAAGMVPVFAAGNPGPFCGEGGSPGDYLEAFSVGATTVNDLIAEFWGRGPSAFGKINPDVAAPGVFVLSSIPGNNYEYFDGTSMAAPHVVGTLALMMSADPALKGDVDAITRLLASTAVDIIDDSCGGDADGDPNNVYRDGRINLPLWPGCPGRRRGCCSEPGSSRWARQGGDRDPGRLSARLRVRPAGRPRPRPGDQRRCRPAGAGVHAQTICPRGVEEPPRRTSSHSSEWCLPIGTFDSVG